MRYRLFGRTGLRVSELVLGAMTLPDAVTARRIVDTYADHGGNMIDTASAYGDSEPLLGQVLTRRDRFVLGTKFALSRDPDDPNAAGAHRKNLIASLEASLRRLRTDHVDVLWLHTHDRHTPAEETVATLDDVVRAGKVRYVGVSDAPAWWIGRACVLAELRGWTAFAGVQVPYSLLNRDIEREILPLAEHDGLTVTAWGVLEHGALPADSPADDPDPRRDAVARELRAVAERLAVTPAQVAIAWTMTRSPAVIPIVGFRRPERVAEAVAALDVDLPTAETTALEAAAPFTPGPYYDFLAACADDPFVVGSAAIRPRPPR